MSRYIATRAIRGANMIVNETEALLQKAIAEKGADTPVAFPNTAYYLPTIMGLTGREVNTLGDLVPVLEQPANNRAPRRMSTRIMGPPGSDGAAVRISIATNRSRTVPGETKIRQGWEQRARGCCSSGSA